MIGLPPGCKVAFTVIIELSELTDTMFDWFIEAGGEVHTKEWHDHRGKLIQKRFVKYGKGKLCHYHQASMDYPTSSQVRLQFHGDDAAVASFFILKFNEYVIFTNLADQMRKMEELTEKENHQ